MLLDERPSVADGIVVGARFRPARSGMAVVICAYTTDRLPTLRTILRIVEDQLDPERDELVVVIDHHDELRAIVELESPRARVLSNSGPRGLSGARNTGVAASTAPVLVFLDDDAVPQPDWLPAWRVVFADPAVQLVGGSVRPDWSAGSAPGWFPAEFGWVVGCDYLGMPPSGARIRNPIGANMAIRRSAIAATQGFSVNLGRVGTLPAGCEETELGIRVGRAHGAEAVRRDTGPLVDHQVPAARATLRYLCSRCFHEGRSKKVLAGTLGTTDALASERSFVVRAMRDGFRRHLASGGAR